MASRRVLSLYPTVFRHYTFHRRITTSASSNSLSSLLCSLLSSSPQNPNIRPQIPSRSFHSTTSSLLSSRPFNDADKIDPDTILFEGCDYKHWLIVMDFPNDPQQRPPAEEMVETYVQTLAKVVGSVEEAKKKMYACSTTTYTGFQAEIDEETAQKFEGMPGVLFVLPDSYIDPVNKEYGGDKYINGTIIPRPPPVQYGRVRRGSRQNDQRTRGPMPNQQGNPAYNQHPGDGRAYMPQQGFPQQQGHQGFPQQQGFGSHQGFPPQQGFPQQQGFPPQQGYPQQHRIPAQQSYGPPGQGERGNPMPSGIYYPGGGRDAYQGGDGSNYMPSHPGNQNNTYNHPQGQMGIRTRDQRDYVPQGEMGPPGANRNYNSPPPATEPYGQTGSGNFDQGGVVQYGPGPGPSRTYAHGAGAGAGYGQGYRPDGQNQRPAQVPDQHGNTFSAEHRGYAPTGPTGMNQGRN